MKHLNGKVAAVTGGGAGIGEALCVDLGSRGVTVAVCELSAVAARSTWNGSLRPAVGQRRTPSTSRPRTQMQTYAAQVLDLNDDTLTRL